MRLRIGKSTLQFTFSFAAVVTLMLLLCDEEIVLVSLFSSLFHECGHLFFMIIFSDIPRLMIFGAFGIRIERAKGSKLSYKKEALIALGGIAGNLLLILCALIFYHLTLSIFSLELLAVNAFIAGFNLIPIRQLDAGRCMEALLRLHRSSADTEKILDIFSIVFCASLSVICVLYNVFFSLNISMIAVTVYLVLISNIKEF